jgi:cyanophycinase
LLKEGVFEMSKGKSTLIAIGGGEISEARDILELVRKGLKQKKDSRLAVMTVATSDPESAAKKYLDIFGKEGIKHVDAIDVSKREDAFSDASLEILAKADALFFTGGDQLNITSLLGGSPLDMLIKERLRDGIVIAGTSAGAAMMSSSMIVSGSSDASPKVSAVKIAPGMELIDGVIIDSHFSQRGRHGRLLTAIAHYPQVLGVGIDERTAIVQKNGSFKVIGEGVVTVMDASQMRHSDLPYRRDNENIGMFGVEVHVLPAGYSYVLDERQPVAPELKKMAGVQDEV